MSDETRKRDKPFNDSQRDFFKLGIAGAGVAAAKLRVARAAIESE
ncbi:MAG: hypothetical protein QNJ02_14565 [Desulfobacterales bacterium]|nr:hypothetical protein [Desulfobacterales bacterium]